MPAQDLATALLQLSAQQHLQLLFDASRMTGRRSADLNVQTYARYEVTYTNKEFPTYIVPVGGFIVQSFENTFAQGGKSISPQTYADFELAYRPAPRGGAGGRRSLEYRLSVDNLLDTRPPLLLIQANTTEPAQALYYSSYGDPRGRRIDLSLLERF